MTDHDRKTENHDEAAGQMQAGNESPSSARRAEVAIAFEHIVKRFKNRAILDDVSFSVPKGEALCILGRSGTGKSVTLKLMIGLLKADSGRVMVMGKDVGGLKEEGLSEMRRNMGFLFQSAALFDSFDVYTNLALPLERLGKTRTPAETKEAIGRVLHQVGLEKDCYKMPVELSGGMQKRAGLARALVLRPEILLVDEPGSGLDRITASEIDELLLQVKREQHTTMVIVTHDIHGARKVGDKFAVLEDGKLLAFGRPEELDERADEHLRQFISESGQ
jgi:phospholipid/cholesterol/gamma-HCH transport system ATP-binding protein